ARLTTASQPASAAGAGGPTRSEIATTSSPRDCRAELKRVPISPEAPVTATRIASDRCRPDAVLVDRREPDRVLVGGGHAAAARLGRDGLGDGGRDVAVEHRRDDVVLAQLGALDDLGDRAGG